MHELMSLASLGSLLADIPPPPPEIPILDATLPHPTVVMLAGLSIALVAFLVGMRWKKAKHGSLGKLAIAAAALVAAITIGAAAWAGGQWKRHQSQLDNWVPLGPVKDWNRIVNDVGDEAAVEGSQQNEGDPVVDTTSEVAPSRPSSAATR